jgi:hypothetical protein
MSTKNIQFDNDPDIQMSFRNYEENGSMQDLDLQIISH